MTKKKWIALDRLRRILAALQAGRALAPEDADALATALERAIHGRSIEAGLGLCGPWRAEWQRAQRDEALLVILGAHTEGSAHGRAREIHRELSRYAAAGYAADRRIGVKPDEGSRGAFFSFLEANGGKGLAAERLRKLMKL